MATFFYVIGIVVFFGAMLTCVLLAIRLVRKLRALWLLRRAHLGTDRMLHEFAAPEWGAYVRGRSDAVIVLSHLVAWLSVVLVMVLCLFDVGLTGVLRAALTTTVLASAVLLCVVVSLLRGYAAQLGELQHGGTVPSLRWRVAQYRAHRQSVSEARQALRVAKTARRHAQQREAYAQVGYVRQESQDDEDATMS